MKKTTILMAATMMAMAAQAQRPSEAPPLLAPEIYTQEAAEVPALPPPAIFEAEASDNTPYPEPAPVRVDDSQKKSYDHYNKVFNTTFKGNEDLNFLKELESWLGTPYLYGGTTKGKGTDCSGFVMTAYKNCYNIKLNRVATYEPSDCNKVGRNELEFGDLLFFADNTGYIYHVGIYLANDIFIHAASSNHVGVRTETLKLQYYVNAYYSAGRVKQLDKRNQQQQTRSAAQAESETAKIDARHAEDAAKEEAKKGNTAQQAVADKPKTYADYEKLLGIKLKGVESLEALREISEWMGTPYKSGGSVKGSGCDSPGLICGIFKNVWKISLNRDPDKMIKNLSKANKKSLNFGDIVFFKKNSSYPIIGFYVGDRKILYTSVSNGVSLLDMDSVKTYQLHYCGSVPALNN